MNNPFAIVKYSKLSKLEGSLHGLGVAISIQGTHQIHKLFIHKDLLFSSMKY